MKNSVTLYRTVKTKDQEEADSEPQVSITEPIRESIVLFVIKIATVLIVTDLIYAVFNFVLLVHFS